jgi:uncharacterized membrane protein
MGILILGLVVFLGIHSVGIFAPALRDRMAGQMGEVLWKAIYGIVALIGLLLIIQGYGAAGVEPVPVWVPPVWMRHLNLLLMLPVFVLLLAAYLPGRIQTTVGHPMLAAVKLWAFGHLLANGNLADILLFGGFLVWAVADRISLKRRTPPSAPSAPAGKANDLIAIVGGLLLYGAFIGGAHLWLFGVSPLGGG